MTSKHKILVVDDEAAIARLLKLVLERTGKYEVATETEGSRAMSHALDFKPNLILLDINMPDVSGGELSEQFKKRSELSAVPVIFLTGAVSPSEVESGVSDIGGRPVIAKPINMEHLVRMIDAHVAG